MQESTIPTNYIEVVVESTSEDIIDILHELIEKYDAMTRDLEIFDKIEGQTTTHCLSCKMTDVYIKKVVRQTYILCDDDGLQPKITKMLNTKPVKTPDTRSEFEEKVIGHYYLIEII